jgi:cytochrome c-type biogenesis protein CcmF
VLWRARFAYVSLGETARRILALRRSHIGATLGHVGMAVTVIGVAGATAWNSELLTVMKPGDTAEIAGYRMTFQRVWQREGPNYVELAGAFAVENGGGPLATIVASKRKYDAPPTLTTEAGISPRLGGDIYVVLGNEAANGAYSVRLYFHPFVRWIWGGALIMFLGGFVSLLDRRLRIGIPQQAAKPAFPVHPAPAE